jgi:hypothetical protein
MTTLHPYSPIIRGTIAAGTGFVGLAAGLALSARYHVLLDRIVSLMVCSCSPFKYSAISFPALARTAGLTKKQKVDFWKATFDQGVSTCLYTGSSTL